MSVREHEINEQMRQFGENLLNARHRAGLSQVTLALKADLDRVAISLLERAERAPTLPTLVRLAHGLELEPADLLHELGSQSRTIAVPRATPRPVRDGATASFGANLRCLREQAALSQECLARLSGVHRSAITTLERERRSPGLRTILILASALDVQPATLLASIE